ncbi:LysR family transcriptional regulator [uncultured Ruminococcus sp.]|uniref:LysR family transcriptional regulator n=1 Tax=uncultured Ruminococcus sp. TaxID=165186 RepID=UPI0025DDAAF2|nr:LysR family transcriptional regulator [uncultured Ruminococcus sp.]
MNLDHLRYFVRLAEVRHYTRAAEQLGISQPSLSHAINQIEAELGVPLFEKSGRNTTLTRFGEEFLECAEHSLSILDAGIETLQRYGRGEGVVRLGFLRTLGINYIPQLTSDFLKADPDCNVQFSFHSGLSSELLEDLIQRKYDFVFCSEPDPALGLNAVAVDSQELVVIVPKDHPLAERESISLAETLPYPAVCFAEGSGLRKIVDRMYDAVGGKPASVVETEEDEVIAGLVSSGFGTAVVPYMDMLEKLEVSVLKITDPPYSRNFFMVQNDAAFLTSAAQRFRSFVLGRTFSNK